MMTGRSIQDVAVELDRQRKTKRDFIVPTSFMSFTVKGELFNRNSGKALPLTSYAHRQVASFLDVPHAYYERMRSTAPELLKSNVDTWLARSPAGTKRMVRTLDGQCRAFLSDRYLPIDNWDVLNVLLPSINEAGCQVVSAEVTESRLYLKAVTPRITGEIAVGDRVQAGILIQNSEVGKGRVEVSPLLWRLACRNGLIVQDMSLRRHHLGRRIQDEDVEANGIYSRETVAADIKAFLLKARDSVKAVLQQEIFDGIVATARAAAGEKIEDTVEYVEDVTDRYGLSDVESKGVMERFIQGGDPTLWGLVNAITFQAHEIGDYDRMVELEKVGGLLLYKEAA